MEKLANLSDRSHSSFSNDILDIIPSVHDTSIMILQLNGMQGLHYGPELWDWVRARISTHYGTLPLLPYMDKKHLWPSLDDL